MRRSYFIEDQTTHLRLKADMVWNVTSLSFISSVILHKYLKPPEFEPSYIYEDYDSNFKIIVQRVEIRFIEVYNWSA